MALHMSNVYAGEMYVALFLVAHVTQEPNDAGERRNDNNFIFISSLSSGVIKSLPNFIEMIYSLTECISLS